MILKSQSIWEPLYLDKNYKGKDVLVEEELARKLTQQQRDGIRFLYRQFKKKNPGVILNDPSGYGKRVQAALFLNSIQAIVDTNFPCLIICYEDDMDKWRECFKLWFPNSNTDVIYEPSNSFANKKIFVVSPTDTAKYCRRKWSVVVVDDCFDVTLKSFKQIKLLADFKIWITNHDLKKKLDTLSLIHQWIYPDGKFDPQDFVPTSTSIAHIVEKKIVLERFLDDFLLQRNNQELKFYCNVKENSMQISKTSKVSKKNKDPTGTKVKSSKKKKVIDEETNVTLDNNAQVSADNDNLDIGNAGIDKSDENIQESNPEVPPKETDASKGTKNDCRSSLSKDETVDSSKLTDCSNAVTGDGEKCDKKSMLEKILSQYF